MIGVVRERKFVIVCGKGRGNEMRRDEVVELKRLVEKVLIEMSKKGEMDLREKREWNVFCEVGKLLGDKLSGRRK